VVVKIIQHIVKTISEMLIWREHQQNPICNSCLMTYIKLKLKVHVHSKSLRSEYKVFDICYCREIDTEICLTKCSKWSLLCVILLCLCYHFIKK